MPWEMIGLASKVLRLMYFEYNWWWVSCAMSCVRDELRFGHERWRRVPIEQQSGNLNEGLFIHFVVAMCVNK